MTPKLRSVQAVLPASLRLDYANGETRLFDMRLLLDAGLFSALRDPALLSAVKIAFDAVEWPNGADIDPERLYEDSVPLERWTAAEPR